MTRLPYLALALTCFVVHPAYAACGAAGCAINTNWETQGPHVGPGWRIDLRFEYIKQDTLRKGANKAAHAEPESSVGAHEEEEEHAHAETAAARYRPVRAQHEGDEHAEGTHAEHDERETLNRNARVLIDYSFNERFGVSAVASLTPYLALRYTWLEASTSPLSGALIEAIREAVDTMDPGALITTPMLAGYTDSYYYRALGIGAYGLDPFRTTEAEDRTVHGNDERVSLANLRFGVEFFYRVVERVAR